MNNDCLFCKIANGEINSERIFENEYVYAFSDINPVAPVHVLVVPKVHIENLNDINDENIIYVTEIMKSIKEIAKIKNISDNGYRLITNTGDDAGQVVKHLHFHLVGGKSLGEKIID